MLRQTFKWVFIAGGEGVEGGGEAMCFSGKGKRIMYSFMAGPLKLCW